MMIAGLIVAVAIGICLMRRFTSEWLVATGTGCAAGIGITSLTFFFARGLAPGAVWLPYGCDAILLAAGVAVVRTAAPATLRLPDWRIAGAVIVALGIATGAFISAWEANPHGDWDAWAIWNLRAKFLASPGEAAQIAYSPLLGTYTHPGYPMLVSAAVGRLWYYGGSTGQTLAPALISYVILFAGILTIASALIRNRGRIIGGLAALCLLGTPILLHESTVQYADVPLAMFMAMALALAVSDHMLLAGICAGLAAWTKNEGIVFALLFFVAAAIRFRRSVVPALAGAAPFLLALAVFKLFMAGGTPSAVTSAANPADAGRWAMILGALFGGFANLGGGGSYHPVLPVVAAAIGLGFARQRRSDAMFGAALALGMTAAYFMVYLLTQRDLVWYLSTSADRLTVQLWPLYVLTVFFALRSPEELAISDSIPARKARKQ